MALAEGTGALRSVKQTERRARINELIILAVLGFFLWQYGVQQWRISQAVKIESITISNQRLLTAPEVCPGDRVSVAFDVDVQGFGIVIWDSSTQRQKQPATLTEAKRVPVDGPVTLPLVDDWDVPLSPDIAINGERKWLPGEYERLITVSASSSYVSRFVEPQKFTETFRIKAKCGM